MSMKGDIHDLEYSDEDEEEVTEKRMYLNAMFDNLLRVECCPSF